MSRSDFMCRLSKAASVISEEYYVVIQFLIRKNSCCQDIPILVRFSSSASEIEKYRRERVITVAQVQEDRKNNYLLSLKRESEIMLRMESTRERGLPGAR